MEPEVIKKLGEIEAKSEEIEQDVENIKEDCEKIKCEGFNKLTSSIIKLFVDVIGFFNIFRKC